MLDVYLVFFLQLPTLTDFLKTSLFIEATTVSFEAISLKRVFLCILAFDLGWPVARYSCWTRILTFPWRDRGSDPDKFACPLVCLSENSLDHL